MSLFNRKEKEKEIKRANKFSVFQFAKIEGLRSNKKEKFIPTEFISPIFGTTVKDETVAPYVNVNTGDKVKQYDFIRTEKKGDMSTYDEFKNVMLTSESRKEIFGEDVHIDKDRKYIDPRKIKEELSVPFTGKEKEQTFVDAFKDNIIEEEKIKIKEPFFEQEEPKQDIYNEPQVKKPVVHNVPFHEFKNEEPDTYEPEIYQEKPITKTDDIKQNIRPEKVRQENIISK